VKSTDSTSHQSVGSDNTFTTTGCTGSSSIETQSGSTITTTVAGTVALGVGTNTGITLTVPAGFATNDAHFQLKELDTSTVIATTSSPTSKTQAGRVYNILALSGATTTVTSFSAALTITMNYVDGDITGLDESTLRIYRWDGSSWNVLSNCSVDTSANSITCTTTAFSDFGIFGDESSSSTTTTTTTAASTGGGGRRGALSQIVSALTGKDSEHASAPERPCDGRILQVEIDGETLSFRDVPCGEWFSSFVGSVVDAGIASGYQDTRGNPTGDFGPANPVTFAEALKMTLEAAGKDPLSVHSAAKNRSSRKQWSENYVALAEELEISILTPGLDVNTSATRGSVLQIIVEALGIEEGTTKTGYDDVPTRHPHAAAIAIATRRGWVQGDTNRDGEPTGTFRPNDPINRAEVAKIIMRVLEESVSDS
jgi:hypothetical protein